MQNAHPLVLDLLEEDRDVILFCIKKDKHGELNALLTRQNLPPCMIEDTVDEADMVTLQMSVNTYTALRALSLPVVNEKMTVFADTDEMLGAEYAQRAQFYRSHGNIDDLNVKGEIMQNMCCMLAGGSYRDGDFLRGGLQMNTREFYKKKEENPDSRQLRPPEPGQYTNHFSKKFLDGTFANFFADVDAALADAGLDPANPSLGSNSSSYYRENITRLYEAYKALRRSGYGNIELTSGLG